MFQELFRGKICGQCSNSGGVFSPVIAVSLLIREKTSYWAVFVFPLGAIYYILSTISFHLQTLLFTSPQTFYHHRLKTIKKMGENIYSNHCSKCVLYSLLHTHTQYPGLWWGFKHNLRVSKKPKRNSFISTLSHSLLQTPKEKDVTEFRNSCNNLKVNQQSVILTHIPRTSIQNCIYHWKVLSIYVP